MGAGDVWQVSTQPPAITISMRVWVLTCLQAGLLPPRIRELTWLLQTPQMLGYATVTVSPA